MIDDTSDSVEKQGSMEGNDCGFVPGWGLWQNIYYRRYCKVCCELDGQ